MTVGSNPVGFGSSKRQDRVTAWEFRDGHYPHQDCEWCRSDRKNNLDEEKYIFIAY